MKLLINIELCERHVINIRRYPYDAAGGRACPSVGPTCFYALEVRGQYRRDWPRARWETGE